MRIHMEIAPWYDMVTLLISIMRTFNDLIMFVNENFEFPY